MKKAVISAVAAMAIVGTLSAQEGDIVFAIDESGSMGPYINAVKSNIDLLINKLVDEGVDYKLGIVAFGGTSSLSASNPRVVQPLTTSVADFNSSLNSITAGGAYEPGFAAVSLGLSAAMETNTSFRPDAGKCVILLSDEDADDGAHGDWYFHVTADNQPAALADLSNSNAIFYGIINTNDTGGNNQYRDGDYGMAAGSLAYETGGAVYNIKLLDTLAEGILEEVYTKCISEAIIPEETVAFDVHPTSCPNPINVKSKGKIPMAIVGTADFDVHDINVSSILVNGVSPTQYSYDDTVTPYGGEFDDENLSKYDCTTEGPDGYTDLVMHFDTQAVVADLNTSIPVQYLEISGTLMDGTPFNGKDVIWVK